MNQSRAQWVRDIEHGALVTLDFRCSREAFEEKMQGIASMHGQTSLQPDPAVSSVFLTPDMCKELGTKATCTLGGVHMHVPVYKEMSQSDGRLYTHASVHVALAGDELSIQLTFVPSAGESGEAGEAAYPTVVRRYTAVPRMWSSYMTEDHSNQEDGMYVHGMRKAVSIIAWWACQAPPRVNTLLPLIPPDFTEEQFVQVLRAMHLEVSPQPDCGEPMEEDHDDNDNSAGAQGGGKVPILAPQPKAGKTRNKSNVLPLHVRMQQQNLELADLLQVKTCEPEQHQHPQPKISVYPIGMINTRMVSLIPAAVDIVNFMRSMCPKEYPNKDIPASLVLGAYNALAHGGVDRLHFIEDVACDEMERYGQMVHRIIQSKNPSSNHWSFGTGVRRFERIVTWDGEDVLVACVRMGSASHPFYAFAFCAMRGKWVPFAVTGMRHQVYCYLPPAADAAPPAAAAAGEVQELCRQVCPETSTLSHRQRFALQQSVIVNGCSMHPKSALGMSKQLLRDLCMEWYQRRAPSMEKGDIAFMLSCMPVLKKALNPYWWFACSVF